MKKVKTPYEISSEHVKAVRTRANLTQEEFAEKIGVSTNAISRIEREEVHLSAAIALKINRHFFVSLDYLFGLATHEEGEPPCSSTCEELLNAQSIINMQDNIIKDLRDKIDIIKNVVTGKEQPVGQKKPDCSD